ncbi:MAG TPA: ABC transporter ATP-binding protein [Burkholderiaceae bacterium]|nr:ABC transporter ATP-binding protein [Burkholderiaceae bacterium]
MTAAEAPTTDLRTLLRRLWAAILAHKPLVAAAVVFGVLEALFTKAPFVLIDPLLRVMAEQTGAKTLLGRIADWLHHFDKGLADRAAGIEAKESWVDWFARWFQQQSDGIAGWFGRDAQSAGGPAMNLVIGAALVAAASGLLGAFCIYGVQLTSRFFAIKMVADLRCAVARHILSLPLRYFGQRRMGELISNVTNDAQVLQRAFELASDNVVVDPMMILGNVAVIVFVMPQALLLLVVMIPLMAVPMYRTGRKVRKRSSRTLAAMGDATESMNQILSGIRTVKAFRLEQPRLQEYEQQNATFLQRTMKMLRAKSMSMTQTFVGYQLGFAFLVLLLGYLVLVTGDVKFPSVATVLLPLSTTYQHVKRLTRSYNTLVESTSALDRIEHILNEQPDVADSGGEPLPELRGAVELDDVWFAYGDEPVLRGVSLVVKPGQTVAFVGPSGAGKSTTMDLLMRFHDPQRGRVLIDGKDLRTLRMDDYRRHTAVVSQQPFLFNSSIRENIAYGRPGCTQAEIEAAAKAANIHDFVVALPQGYDTLAGERGCNLSGGQMQRITIARAIVRDPAILFLDEATASLDSENEGLVQRALDNLRRGRTSFVIAHRLSTIAQADLIVVFEQGRIVETGTHEQLVALGGTYKRMRDLQTA